MQLDHDRAARAVAEAVTGGDKAAAVKYGISVRSLRRWRQRLQADSHLAALVREKKAVVERTWVESLPTAIAGAVEFLARATDPATGCSPKDPDAVHAIAGAFKLLTEVEMSRRLLEARLAKAAGGKPASH